MKKNDIVNDGCSLVSTESFGVENNHSVSKCCSGGVTAQEELSGKSESAVTGGCEDINKHGNPEPVKEGKRPVAVGNKVTLGWSNPFGGTSWGV